MRFLAPWLAVALAGCAIGATSPQSQSTTVTFRNKHRFYFDVEGNAIDSVNGKIDWIDNQYFWIATPQACGQRNCPTVSYSSRDLKHWVYNGALFPTSNSPICSGGGCGRPKVIYNKKTKKYVYYGFNGLQPDRPGVPVFTSDFLSHGYTYAGQMLTEYVYDQYVIEDLGLSVIDDKAYLSWTGFNGSYWTSAAASIWPAFSQTVLVQQLTDDFLNGTGKAYPVIDRGGEFPVTSTSPNQIDGQVESPDLFKRGNRYYLVGSGTCAFCNGTATVAYIASSPFGPWRRQIVDSEETCGGQAMGVATIPSTDSKAENTYLYQADAFSSAPSGLSWTAASGHSIWTLKFSDSGSIRAIDCDPEATFTVRVPLGSKDIATTGTAYTASDGSGNDGDYWAESGIPAAQIYQTWTSSKSGTLKTVGVNLAAGSVSQNMTLTVFRYSNEKDLLSPWYVWEELTTMDVGPATPISTAFKVFQIPVNQPILKGDRLGLFIGIGGTVSIRFPNALGGQYGYLLHEIEGRRSNHKLYAMNRRHVSYQGPSGDQSPVYELKDREIKWYAVVE